MNIFEKVAKKFGLVEEKSKTEQIKEDRENIKLNLAVKMYEAGFFDEEIEAVLAIIQNAENDIQKIKDSLIGTNINPKGDPMAPLAGGVQEIRARQLQMQKEINEALAEFSKNHQK